MADNYDIKPHHDLKEHGRVFSVAQQFHRKKKLFPKRNLHQITQVKLNIDGQNRLRSNYQHHYDTMDARRMQSLEVDSNGRQLLLDATDKEAAGVATIFAHQMD